MRRLAVLAAALLVLVLLGVAQIVLPGLAADQLRDQLGRHGRVISVDVSAFPAIELLWHRADRVQVRMASYTAASGTLGSAVAQTTDAGAVDASAATLTAGLLVLHDAQLHKRGGRLTGSAQVREADLLHAVPFLTDVRPVADPNGPLVLQGTATLLGVSATVDAAVTASGGRILVTPEVPFGGLATLTLFASPHLAVDSVSATPAAGGFGLLARGHVR